MRVGKRRIEQLEFLPTDDKEEGFEAEEVARIAGGGVSGIVKRIADLPGRESKGGEPKQA